MTISLRKISRASDASFTWLDGHVERVATLTERDGRTFVLWPESVRTVTIPGMRPFTGLRPGSWVDTDRLARP